MTKKVAGWFIGLAGLGMILHLLSGDFKELESWKDLTYPAVVSGIMEHVSAVITAFIGGNLVPSMFKFLFPSNDDSNSEDKVSDKKRNELAGV